MSDPTEAALALWGMSKAHCSFVAGRENRVYKVTNGALSYALRFKRPGYRSVAELTSELQWLAAMDQAGLNVPRPLTSRNGNLLEEVKGQSVDLLTWLDGDPLGQSKAPLDLEGPVIIFAKLGAEMARLHIACDAWEPPAGFTRCHWDSDGLLGETPVWGRFWENPTLAPQTRSLLEDFRACATRDLAALDLDTGLVHADLVRENVLCDGETISFIDFDDGGYGYRLFDVATALLKNLREPNYDAIKEALLDGYLKVRSLDLRQLDLFLALRAVTYVGWVVPRMEEAGSARRNLRFIQDAEDLCSRYLKATTPM